MNCLIRIGSHRLKLVTLKFVAVFIFFSVTLLLQGCSEDHKVKSEVTSELELPVLLNFPSDGEIIDTTAQIESFSFPIHYIKSPGDTINFNDSINNILCLGGDRPISSTNNVELYVDTGHNFAGKFREAFPMKSFIIELDEDGNEIPKKPYQAPYNEVIKIPVYIHNSSDSIQAIEKHDGRLVIIQEALTKNGEWKPIEYFEYSGCGNSYGSIGLDTNSFLLFGIPKYFGSFDTKLRVRLKTNGKIILSNEFEGSINPGQFEVDSSTIRYGHNRYLNE